MLAASFIFLLSLSSLLVLRYILQQQEGYANMINISDRQRMLSQNIILLAHEIVENHQKSASSRLKEQIDYSINLMAQSHQRLTAGKTVDGSGVELNDTLYTIFFQPPFEVDRLVTEYLADIKNITTKPASKKTYEELAALSATARGKLLTGLNEVVQQYQAERDRYSTTYKNGIFVIFFLVTAMLAMSTILWILPVINRVVKNEEMLHSVLDSLPILIDIVNDKGTILYQSQYLIERLGKATIGQKCFEAYRTDQKKCNSCPALTTHGREDSDQKISTCFDRLSIGNIVEITHKPIIFNGQEAFFHSFTDITEQLMSEAFLMKAREEASHAGELKSNFLTNMSHEIRTPMNAIIGFTNLALETDLNKLQQDYLEKIDHSSKSLLKIFNDILLFSKADAGELTLKEETFNLNEVLEHTVALFANKAQEKDIQFLMQHQPDIPSFLFGDPLRLHQILVNLLANSVKFTDQGKITVQVDIESLNEHQVKLKFSVSDTGIGINKKKLATLFDSFSQADNSTTRKYSGTGLGLAISKQLVKLMGGKIALDSQEGKGSVFSFSIPFTLATTAGNSKAYQWYEKDICNSTTNLNTKYGVDINNAIARIKEAHILLVDDNPINRQLTKEILAKADIILDTASNGKQALDKITKEKSEYDVILMDIQMPVMDGVECTRELRNYEKKNREKTSQQKKEMTPIIAMTANAMYGDQEKYLQALMNDYITKPINQTELFGVLAKWIPEDRGTRRVRQNLFNRRHGRDRREDFDNRGHNSKDSRQVDDEHDVELEYSLPDNLPGIDLKQGLARVEGNTMLYFRLLNMFVEDYASIDLKIQTAIHDNNLESVDRIVHTVKGVAGSIGAQRLAKAALSYEKSTKNGKHINEELAQFIEALQQTLTSLGTLPYMEQPSKTTYKTDQSEDDEIAEGIPLSELHSTLS
jgi:signal transduction histidine kinase/CheY-like chemotaxis protein